jgi:hypothetical protein
MTGPPTEPAVRSGSYLEEAVGPGRFDWVACRGSLSNRGRSSPESPIRDPYSAPQAFPEPVRRLVVSAECSLSLERPAGQEVPAPADWLHANPAVSVRRRSLASCCNLGHTPAWGNRRTHRSERATNGRTRMIGCASIRSCWSPALGPRPGSTIAPAWAVSPWPNSFLDRFRRYVHRPPCSQR